MRKVLRFGLLMHAGSAHCGRVAIGGVYEADWRRQSAAGASDADGPLHGRRHLHRIRCNAEKCCRRGS